MSTTKKTTRPIWAVVQQSVEQDNCEGWCFVCGEIVEGVEPDARKYECDVCGEKKVYGMEEVLLMGWFI